MPIRPRFDEYRAKGHEAELQATLADHPAVKRQLDDIAREWFDLAERVKRIDD